MRVMAHAITNGKAAYGGFQLYTLCAASHVAPLPHSVSYDQAVVLPLAISTAAAGLFQVNCLALPFPESPLSFMKTIVVLGGSSSVGSTVIQLAVAAGVGVFATSSPDDLDYVKGFGALQVFDHSKSSIVEDIYYGLINMYRASSFAGIYDAVSSPDTIRNSAMLAARVGRIVVTTQPMTEGFDLPKNVEVKYVLASSFMPPTSMWNDVESAVWGKLVPGALADGKLQCKPDRVVVGEGLAKLQDGLDRLQKGDADEKLVIKVQSEC